MSTQVSNLLRPSRAETSVVVFRPLSSWSWGYDVSECTPASLRIDVDFQRTIGVQEAFNILQRALLIKELSQLIAVT